MDSTAKHKFLTSAGIHDVNPDQPLRILIANFSKCPVKLNVGKVADSAGEHREFITKSHITQDELGITELDANYQKRDMNVRDVDKAHKDIGPHRL